MGVYYESISQLSLFLENVDHVQVHREVQQIIDLPKWETFASESEKDLT